MSASGSASKDYYLVGKVYVSCLAEIVEGDARRPHKSRLWVLHTSWQLSCPSVRREPPLMVCLSSDHKFFLIP